jgi:hypothetical protein
MVVSGLRIRISPIISLAICRVEFLPAMVVIVTKRSYVRYVSAATSITVTRRREVALVGLNCFLQKVGAVPRLAPPLQLLHFCLAIWRRRQLQIVI